MNSHFSGFEPLTEQYVHVLSWEENYKAADKRFDCVVKAITENLQWSSSKYLHFSLVSECPESWLENVQMIQNNTL